MSSVCTDPRLSFASLCADLGPRIRVSCVEVAAGVPGCLFLPLTKLKLPERQGDPQAGRIRTLAPALSVWALLTSLLRRPLCHTGVNSHRGLPRKLIIESLNSCPRMVSRMVYLEFQIFSSFNGSSVWLVGSTGASFAQATCFPICKHPPWTKFTLRELTP